ncbi:uncharacterized protein V1513DRAFT_443021 [Lipomyces chichibuensis]|uniref:uncharacterized protein n=1 Tax=Lipomyces chichibuensis TaxID=1546026 RepID=UPI003343C7FE
MQYCIYYLTMSAQTPSSKRKGGADVITEQKRRTVFRPVLDNPHTKVLWPAVSAYDGKLFVDLLCSILQPVSTYIDQKTKIKRHKKKSSDFTSSPDLTDDLPKPARPDVLNYLTLGFNPTTFALESQTSSIYAQPSYIGPTTPTTAPSSKKNSKKHPIMAVFIARSDITPAILLSHFPLLCASSSFPVKLVQLPKGSLALLAQATSMPGLGIVAIRQGCPDAGMLFNALERIEDVVVPWTEFSGSRSVYETVNIKQIVTSAPIVNASSKKNREDD